MNTDDEFDRDTEIGFGRYAKHTLGEIGQGHLEYLFWCLTARQVKDRPALHSAIEDVVIEELQGRRHLRALGIEPVRRRLVAVLKPPPTMKCVKTGRHPVYVPIDWTPPVRQKPAHEETLEEFCRRIA
jgi:hypothetical protein